MAVVSEDVDEENEVIYAGGFNVNFRGLEVRRSKRNLLFPGIIFC